MDAMFKPMALSVLVAGVAHAAQTVDPNTITQALQFATAIIMAVIGLIGLFKKPQK